MLNLMDGTSIVRQVCCSPLLNTTQPHRHDTMSDALIPSGMLFRIALPCYYFDGKWTKAGAALDERYVITSFDAELNLGPRFAELRLGWNEAGLYIHLRTTGKKQAPWCRDTRAEDSDGLSLLIDTRNTQNIHRAGRFCHRFVFMPQGSGRLLNEPTAKLIEINRSRENPKPAPETSLRVLSEKRIDGYVLSAFIDAKAITGFDTEEHPRLGFSYAIIDRELGWQTFTLGPEFPFLSDPSLWGTLELRS